jgi:hypothetical protein
MIILLVLLLQIGEDNRYFAYDHCVFCGKKLYSVERETYHLPYGTQGDVMDINEFLHPMIPPAGVEPVCHIIWERDIEVCQNCWNKYHYEIDSIPRYGMIGLTKNKKKIRNQEIIMKHLKKIA